MSAKLISIIGPPAAGKTTLAENLAPLLGAGLIREDYAGNPFLAQSYEGLDSARLPGQLYFLMSRVGQLAIATWPEAGTFVSDYGFCQDAVFARQRLAADDFRMYERLAPRVEGLVHPPDVLICLEAAPRTLIGRIERRGRGFERVMDEGFLQAMSRAYKEIAARMTCPVIRIDCDKMDVREQIICEELARRIQTA